MSRWKYLNSKVTFILAVSDSVWEEPHLYHFNLSVGPSPGLLWPIVGTAEHSFPLMHAGFISQSLSWGGVGRHGAPQCHDVCTMGFCYRQLTTLSNAEFSWEYYNLAEGS